MFVHFVNLFNIYYYFERYVINVLNYTFSQVIYAGNSGVRCFDRYPSFCMYYPRFPFYAFSEENV